MNKRVKIVSVLLVMLLMALAAMGSGSSGSSSKKTVTCPSCNKEVSSLKRREIFKGNGDWKEWCYDCWDDFDRLSPYDYE